MGYLIDFDEEKNVVEIWQDGINAQLLAEINLRLIEVENEIENDNTNTELDELEDDIDSLTTLVQAQSSALTAEISDRQQGDYSLAEHTTNELIDQQQEYSRMIIAEAELRAQAILDEATARGAAIAESEAIIMTDVAILATSVEGMATELGAAQSSIIEVQDSLVTETMARTAQYTVIQADYADSHAAILEESVARSDTDTALAYAISLLEVGVGENNAAVLAERLARIEEDEALAAQILLVTAQTNENTAAISEETLARTTKDTALASDITELEVTVGEVSGSVTTEASARIAADESINSKYAVKVNAGGKVAGFGLIAQANADSSFSAFVVDADRFQVFNGASDLPPFEVVGGVVYMRNVRIGTAVIEDLAVTNLKIGNLAVNTPKIEEGAVTVPISVQTTWTTFGSGTWITIAIASITNTAPAPFEMQVIGMVTANMDFTSGDRGWSFLVYGFDGATQTFTYVAPNGGAIADTVSFQFTDVIPNGVTRDYHMLWSGHGTIQMGNRTITLLGTKR